MPTLLVSPSPQNAVLARIKALLRSCPGFQTIAIANFDRAEPECQRLAPDLAVVILTPELRDRGVELIRKLHGAGAGQLIAVGPATDPKMILRSLQSGADLFLDQAELETELPAALSQRASRAEPAKKAGRLMAVLSCSGGCGASTLAVNLAALLAREQGQCHLIDLHPGKADLAPLLDITPQYTLADLCRNEARLDRSLYEKLLERHGSGISLLAAPHDFSDAASITPGCVGQILTLATQIFPNVVVDLEDCFHAEQLLVLQQATEIVLVCRLDFTAIRNTRRILDHLAKLNIPATRIRVVANHYGLAEDLPVTEAEEALGVKLTGFIPHDPETIALATNTGIPAAIKSPASAVVNQMAALVGLEKKDEDETRLVPRLRSLLRTHVLAWSIGDTPLLKRTSEGMA